MKKGLRLLKLVALLHRSSRYKAQDLATLLGCSERQIYRDLSDLSSIGIPVYFDKDGYKLLSRHPLACLALTPKEMITLQLGLTSPAITRHPEMAEVAGGILSKFNLPGPTNRKGEHSRVAASISSGGKRDLQLSPETYIALLKAIEQCHTVHLSYHPLPAAAPEERTVDPYILTYRRDHWYLVGYCHNVQKIGLFRVDRIRSCSIALETFTPPLEFDLDHFFEAAWEVFPGENPTRVVVEFSPELSRIVTETQRHPSQRVQELSDGRVIFEVTVSDLREVRWWLMTFGGGVKVLEPPALVEEIQSTAREILSKYN